MSSLSRARYNGFGDYELLARSQGGQAVVDYLSTVELSYDVHNAWRSTLRPGLVVGRDIEHYERQPVTTPDSRGYLQTVDVANMPPAQLPPAIKQVSYRSANLIYRLLDRHVACEETMTAQHIESLAVALHGAWEALKSGRHMPKSAIQNRHEQLRFEPGRVILLDQRLILVGIASMFDDQRFPAWESRHDMAAVRNRLGMAAYADKGRQILEAVQGRKTVPLGSAVDRLELYKQAYNMPLPT